MAWEQRPIQRTLVPAMGQRLSIVTSSNSKTAKQGQDSLTDEDIEFQNQEMTPK